GDEICHVNGFRYAKDVLKASLRFMLQTYHLFYDVRFHPDVVFNRPAYDSIHPQYEAKMGLHTPHSMVCQDPSLVSLGANVLDIGCASGYVADQLAWTRQCRVTGVDLLPPSKVSSTMARYERIDLDLEAQRLVDL